MRGAHCPVLRNRASRRIIPADAGSTPPAPSRIGSFWDHPRGCGEHPMSPSRSWKPLGSSPRMRGAREAGTFEAMRRRIIPADAGSTRPAEDRHRCRRDHPRGCGEHADPKDQYLNIQGSSPRMRGAQRGQARVSNRAGIIPADAGSTVSPRIGEGQGPDHPRGCGEHT